MASGLVPKTSMTFFMFPPLSLYFPYILHVFRHAVNRKPVIFPIILSRSCALMKMRLYYWKNNREGEIFMRNELIALRGAMEAAGVDAYVVPTDDFHGSEYAGEYFMCRKYVSGFTGSAGTLVATADWAGLWTDGRYFLQAADQLRGSGIELMKMGQPGVPTIRQWLESHLQEGQVLGFDGRTMTCSAGKDLAEAAALCGAEVDYELDLVGRIWEDRPEMSREGVWALPLEYTGRTRGEKIRNLREEMEKDGADVHILTSLDDICWLLNFRGGDVACCPVVLSFLILTRDTIRWYVDESKVAPFLKKGLEKDGIEIRPYLDVFADVTALDAGEKVLIDPAKVSYAIARSIPGPVTEARNPTELPKAIKTPQEQQNMRNAHIQDGIALVKFMKWLHGNVGRTEITEISAAEKLESLRKQRDFYLEPSFDPIFGYGPHGAIIHYSATEETNAAVEPEGFLLSDTGGHYLEGTTDVTRTFVVGPLTEEMKHHYTMVLRAHLALLGARFKKGATGANLDVLARKPFWDEGLDYNHGTGHGVGYLMSVHEGPQSISYQKSGGHVPLEPGMIVSDEPGLYLEGEYGIRLENLVLCVEKETGEYGTFYGFEPLTMCPFEREAILPEEMTAQELSLLNAYQQTVFEKISPFLCEEGAAWLRAATAPI